MEQKEIFKMVGIVLKRDYGIDKFKISNMKLNDKNFSINTQGMLCYERTISVTIQPETTTNRITININLTPTSD